MNAVRDSVVSRLRRPPASIEAEQAVLGGVMLSPKALAKVSGVLSEADFYRADHALIWQSILDLEAKGQPFDAVTMAEWFEAQGLSHRVDGGAYLIELSSTTPSAANVEAYAKIVRDKSMLRSIIEIGTDAVSAAFEAGSDTMQVADAAIRSLMALSTTQQQCEFTLRQALSLAFRDANAAVEAAGKLRGITTGFGKIDKRIGGWHNGDLIFIGARPSMGKTALMVNLALSASKAGHAVGVISGEQSAMQIGQRSIAAESRVNAERLRNGDIDDEAWAYLTEAVRTLNPSKFWLYDRSAPTLDEIARVARRWKQEHGMEVLFVDYLQRIRHPKSENRIDEVSEVARGLKTLARDLEVPVVCLAQVKAAVDSRQDKRPGLGDIANSDEATREADLIAFLYRDEVYHDAPGNRNIAELNVEKYRHGPTGQFKLRFDGETMKFADLAPESEW